ncbi:MAG TPA: hypothetical protein VN047_02265 [Sphingopyxis sp.]|uniref:hypothetical protein n=1 Tax=Sphingopyxis sp. TaxID=1908224 RepID=UPI002CCBF7BD|nr:hypothetical protein [Sphingopyxis sp.]HWW55694.1 hypothetical protein [Sphingopyxis sp.]
MPAPADFEAVKQVYTDFGKIRCTSCEGGYAYDGWPVFPRSASAERPGLMCWGYASQFSASEGRNEVY